MISELTTIPFNYSFLTHLIHNNSGVFKGGVDLTINPTPRRFLSLFDKHKIDFEGGA